MASLRKFIMHHLCLGDSVLLRTSLLREFVHCHSSRLVIKQCVTHMELVTGDGNSRAQAGAVAAAARELRPVEIVGLYEEQSTTRKVFCAAKPASSLWSCNHCAADADTQAI